MNKYGKYTYGRTLRFFEAYYPYDTEDVHYADVMLSMNQCTTIDELIEIRERLRGKIKKIGGVDILDKLPKKLIESLSKSTSSSNVYQHWTITVQDNLRIDVNSCYDENLFRLFNESKEITEKICGECFVNMTYCTPQCIYKDKIISEAKERGGIDVSGLLKMIAKRYREFNEHWNTYKTFKEGMNGYNAAKLAVEEDFEYLKQFNWRLLPWQKSLYSKIDREEVKKKELQAKLLKERKEKRKREEKEEIERKHKIQRKWAIVKIILGILLFVGIIFLLAQIPSGVWNWIWAIIVYLAIMKTILKKM